MTVKLTDANFAKEIKQGVVLVDFWAPWCGPCRIVGPILEEVADSYSGRAVIGKLNVDENQQTTGEFGIMSIPTMKIFKDGQPVDKIIGAVPKQVITEKLDQYVQ